MGLEESNCKLSWQYDYPPLNAIFAFSTSDIWLSSGVPVHGDGNIWTQYHLFDMGVLSQSDGSISKIFGSNPGDLCFVGNKGTIVRYNGSIWSKMTSGTTVDLQDIYGIDATHIWATGANTNDGHSVILSFDGTKWNIIYDSNNVPVQEWYNYNSVWTDNSNLLFLASGGLLRKLKLTTMSFTTINTGQTYISSQIRGIKQNDIFVIGQGSEVAHGNGLSWYVYPSLKTFANGDAWWLAVYPTHDFVVVGGGYYFGYNFAPVVVRGYR